MKAELAPAFLIHRRHWRESSALVDFLTEDYGMVRLLSRGFRRGKNRMQMFQHLKISFIGKSNLKTLTHFETDDTPRTLFGEKLILGFYANELLARLLHPFDAHPAIFAIYQTLIRALGDETSAPAARWRLRIFEHQLLALLGFGADFRRTVRGEKIRPEGCYHYFEHQGFLLSENETGAISGALILRLADADFDAVPDLSELKILRDLNRVRLKNLLGKKPLKSRSLIFHKKPQ